MTFNADIRSFSSYTKGLHEVSGISVDQQFAEIKLRLPMDFQAKLEKRNEKFQCSVLSVDGVYAQISFVKPEFEEPEYFEIVAKIGKDFFMNSSLPNLQQGNKVSIGMVSNNPDKWLLDSLPIGKVKLNQVEIAKDHTYTKELSFECSKDIFERIHKLQYIGLNASGLFIREPRSLDGRYYFSIHAGRNTRDTTVFGRDDLTLGTEFTLTLPFF
ncbi:MAG TPA: hypothetical protein VGP47_05855 [Parachlamydiaceae bacterium]|nr:hypothetical protein [Parachlamydiaceae bacterium]